MVDAQRLLSQDRERGSASRCLTARDWKDAQRKGDTAFSVPAVGGQAGWRARVTCREGAGEGTTLKGQACFAWASSLRLSSFCLLGIFYLPRCPTANLSIFPQKAKESSTQSVTFIRKEGFNSTPTSHTLETDCDWFLKGRRAGKGPSIPGDRQLQLGKAGSMGLG